MYDFMQAAEQDNDLIKSATIKNTGFDTSRLLFNLNYVET